MSPERCSSFFPPLFQVAGVKVFCERSFGHLRSMHQTTDEQGRRTRWAWTREERIDVKERP